MKIVLMLLLAVLLNLPATSAFAVTAKYHESTAIFSTGVDAFVPSCGANQVLTYNGRIWACVNNFTPVASCLPNQAIQTINGSGTATCAAILPPSIPNCPAGTALSSINGTSCIPVDKPPLCATNQVLSSHDGVHLNCEQGTESFAAVSPATLGFYTGGLCTAANAYGDDIPWPTPAQFAAAGIADPPGACGGHPCGITVFSGYCISGCNRFCADPANGTFDGGTMVEWSGAMIGCICLR